MESQNQQLSLVFSLLKRTGLVSFLVRIIFIQNVSRHNNIGAYLMTLMKLKFPDYCVTRPYHAKRFKVSPHFDWWIRTSDRSEEKTPGISQALFYTCMSLVYLALLILSEHGIFKRAWNSFAQSVNVTLKTSVSEDDVAREKERVANILQKRQSSDESIVVSNLSNNYGNFSAVSNLTFGVHHGECFGLLGVNGAGNILTYLWDFHSCKTNYFRKDY